MHRALLAVVALTLAAPAFADSPPKGSFGLGATLAGVLAPATASIATVENGLRAMYWVDEKVLVSGGLGLVSTENVGTQFSFSGGGSYYFNKSPKSDWALFAAGALGISVFSRSGGGSDTSFFFLLGGGVEYFFSRHFGVQIAEGLQLSTKPTTFGLATRIGLNWYF